jgi:hypothetical protein
MWHVCRGITGETDGSSLGSTYAIRLIISSAGHEARTLLAENVIQPIIRVEATWDMQA